MPDNPKRFHRRSIRFNGYDYSLPGAYFITIVTQHHKCIFGKIVDNEMYMYNLGEIVQDCWESIPAHFQNLEVIPFVIMPNHLHGIITIHEDDRRGTIYRAPTKEQYGKPVIGSIPTIMRTYKAAVTRRANRELGMINIWQRNYYEHIIRDQSELADCVKYIYSNPGNWADDPEYIN